MDVSDVAVVEAFGVVTEQLGEAQDRVAADLAQPGRGADAAAVGEVLGEGGKRVRAGGEAKQGCVGAFGEVGAAGGTVQTADAVPRARPAMQTQVASAALTV